MMLQTIGEKEKNSLGHVEKFQVAVGINGDWNVWTQ
jgi:hypothetical protein